MSVKTQNENLTKITSFGERTTSNIFLNGYKTSFDILKQVLVLYHLFSSKKSKLMMMFWFDSSVTGKGNSGQLKTSKKGFQQTWHLALSGVKNFSAHHLYPGWVLASFLRIISVRRNKREYRTMLQSDFNTLNVS